MSDEYTDKITWLLSTLVRQESDPTTRVNLLVSALAREASAINPTHLEHIKRALQGAWAQETNAPTEIPDEHALAAYYVYVMDDMFDGVRRDVMLTALVNVLVRVMIDANISVDFMMAQIKQCLDGVKADRSDKHGEKTN